MDAKTNTFAIDRRGLLIGAGFTICGGASYVMQPRKTGNSITETTFQKLLPTKVGQWTSRVSSDLILPITDELSEKLYENLETLVYEGPNLPSIMFLIAYSSIQQNDIQVHRPEVCYPMSGFPILDNQPLVALIGNSRVPSRFLIADRESQNEMILYWTRVGRKYPLDWNQQRIEMARAGLLGVIPDGALVRFSMISDSETDAVESLTNFAGLMKSSLSQRALEVFFGPTTK